MIVHRNHAVGSAQTVDLDFNSSEAFAPQMFDIEAPGASQAGFIDIYLRTSNGALIRTSRVVSAGQYAALPANKRASGDLYVAWGGEEVWPNKIRLAAQIFRNPADKTLNLPQVFGAASVWSVGGALLRVGWDSYAGAELYEITYEHNGIRSRAMSGRDWLMFLSKTWLDGANAYTTPDFRTVAGWNSAWNLDTQTAIEWTVGAYDANVGNAKILAGMEQGYMIPLVDGASSRYSAVLGRHD
jgi:hypothetical protein